MGRASSVRIAIGLFPRVIRMHGRRIQSLLSLLYLPRARAAKSVAGPLRVGRNKNIQFDPVKDFAGITRVASVPLVAVVPASFPANTLAEFIAIAKEKPGQLNFSSAGIASTTFLCAEIMRQTAGISLVHVPYKG